jgi:hypothetical protein
VCEPQNDKHVFIASAICECGATSDEGMISSSLVPRIKAPTPLTRQEVVRIKLRAEVGYDVPTCAEVLALCALIEAQERLLEESLSVLMFPAQPGMDNVRKRLEAFNAR